MNKLRVFLADDHKVLRQGIRSLVNAETDMEICGEAGDGKSTVRLVLDQKPDLVVMDVSMPNLNGKAATEQIKKVIPEVKILALTRHADSSYVQQLLEAGVDGYLLKQSDSDELIRALRMISAGKSYIDPSLTDKLIRGYTGGQSNKKVRSLGLLSQREEQTLRFIALGHSNKEIAAELSISVKTVEAHKANAMKKLELQDRVDIVRYASLQGWLEDL